MSQCDKLLKHFRKGRTITRIEAIIEYRIFNLTARICDLRDMGIDVRTRIKTDAHGTPYAEYSLAH